VAQVQVWNQDDFFPPGCYVLDVLEERADDFDCAVIIFAADDTAEIKGKKCLIARDNTVLEYGFFSARLGRKRTFVLVPDIKDLRVPSDMHGLTLIRYPAKLSPASMDGDLSEACKQLRAAIAGVEPRSEANDLSESMVIVLAALADDKNTDEAGDTLARFDAAHSGPGWKRAAGYFVTFFNHLGLTRPDWQTRTRLTLTSKGTALVQSDSFKERLRKIRATERARGCMI
jgi:Predicted nucleotide-binding protein containing TIR-like domain